MEEEKKKTKEREWWEIPARCLILVVLILVMIPGQWYRAAYIHTIGKIYPDTIESRIKEIEPETVRRLQLKFMPTELKFLILKEERSLEIWGKDPSGKWQFLYQNVILTMSSKKGPKLLEDDGKTPEGVYRITRLNPQSVFLLALELDYPSEEDKKTARAQGIELSRMGQGMEIHGFGLTADGIGVTDRGLYAMFYLAAKVGLEHTQVIISPNDFRKRPPSVNMEPAWLLERYKMLEKELNLLKMEESSHAETGSN